MEFSGDQPDSATFRGDSRVFPSFGFVPKPFIGCRSNEFRALNGAVQLDAFPTGDRWLWRDLGYDFGVARLGN